jgi:hypothetical protein
MSPADVHLIPLAEGWELRRAGALYPTSRHRTRWSALKAARTIAAEAGATVIIHELDGRVLDLSAEAAEAR